MNKDKLKSVLIRAREYVMTAKQNAETRREYYMDDGQSEIMNDARSLISKIDSIIKEVDNDPNEIEKLRLRAALINIGEWNWRGVPLREAYNEIYGKGKWDDLINRNEAEDPGMERKNNEIR